MREQKREVEALRQMLLPIGERITIARRAIGDPCPPAFLDDAVLIRLRERGDIAYYARTPVFGDCVATDGTGNVVVVEVTEAGRARADMN